MKTLPLPGSEPVDRRKDSEAAPSEREAAKAETDASVDVPGVGSRKLTTIVEEPTYTGGWDFRGFQEDRRLM